MGGTRGGYLFFFLIIFFYREHNSLVDLQQKLTMLTSPQPTDSVNEPLNQTFVTNTHKQHQQLTMVFFFFLWYFFQKLQQPVQTVEKIDCTGLTSCVI